MTVITRNIQNTMLATSWANIIWKSWCRINSPASPLWSARYAIHSYCGILVVLIGTVSEVCGLLCSDEMLCHVFLFLWTVRRVLLRECSFCVSPVVFTFIFLGHFRLLLISPRAPLNPAAATQCPFLLLSCLTCRWNYHNVWLLFCVRVYVHCSDDEELHSLL